MSDTFDTTNKPLSITIDLDGVMYDLAKACQKAFFDAGLITRSQAYMPIVNWDFWRQEWNGDGTNFTDKEFWDLFGEFVKDGKIYWEDFLIEEDVVDSLLELVSMGIDLHLVTARVVPSCLYESRSATFYWLMNELGPVPWKSITISSDKTIHGSDIAIDDSIGNLNNLIENNILAVAYDQPWNQDWEGHRVSSMKEFVIYVRDLLNGKN